MQKHNVQAVMLLMVALAAVPARAADPVPVAGSTDLWVGYPTGASSDKTPYSIDVYYIDPTGKLAMTAVTVPDIPVTAGLPNPTVAQINAASAAKAAAIIKAINAANIAIQPVTINGMEYKTLTAAANKPVPGGMYPTGNLVPQVLVNRFGQKITVMVPELAPADFSGYTAYGVRQAIIMPGTPVAKLGSPIYRTKGNTVTGEIGNAKAGFTPASMSSPGSSSSMTYGGLGANTGLTTGMDASGGQSVVAFGFIDETTPTPVDYLAAFDPPSGLTDADVLFDLAALFNEDYSSDGYTASYDPNTDLLSINQMLPAADVDWSANSDTGLFLDDSVNSAPTPEPDSLLLLGTGLAGLALLWRRQVSMTPPTRCRLRGNRARNR